MSDVLRCPVCSCAAFFSTIRTRDRGCSAHPAFPAPPELERAGSSNSKPRAQCVARMRKCAHCTVRRQTRCRPGLDPGPITPGSSFAKGVCYRALIERSRGVGPGVRRDDNWDVTWRFQTQLNALRSFCAISSSAGLCFTMRFVLLTPDITPAASRPRWLSAIKLSKIGSSSLQNSRL